MLWHSIAAGVIVLGFLLGLAYYAGFADASSRHRRLQEQRRHQWRPPAYPASLLTMDEDHNLDLRIRELRGGGRHS